MLKKWIGKIHLASYITLIVDAIFLCVYYVIKKNHEVPMELWAILSLAIPLAILCITSLIVRNKKIDLDESFENNRIYRYFCNVLTVLCIIPVLPVVLIIAVVSAIVSSSKRAFKPLIKIGFKYQYKDKKYTLQKGNVKIEIPYNKEEYLISFDSGESFVKIEESHLGTADDRQELRLKLNEYLNAHSLDKQRGDAYPPLTDYVAFLKKHLS